MAAGLYALAVRIRNRLYDRGWLRAERSPLPVISIGNVTAGGSGKTPLTLYLAERLLAAGVPVGVLTRGYGRRERKSVILPPSAAPIPGAEVIGDEPWLLRKRLPALVLGVDAHRRRAAQVLASYLPNGVYLLDDGFQHRALRRELDVVVVAAGEPLARGHLLPQGRLREPPASLARADWIVVVLPPASDVSLASPALGEVISLAPGKPVAVARPSLCGLHRLGEERMPLEPLPPGRVAAVAGIARPERLTATLEAAGLDVAERIEFADHHRYAARDVEVIASRSRGLAAIVTTEKDEPRLLPWRERLRESGTPVWVAVIDLELLAGEEALLAAVAAVAGKALEPSFRNRTEIGISKAVHRD